VRVAGHNRELLARHWIYATGTTGTILGERLDIPVRPFLSGPLGGDQQIGAGIAEGTIADMIVTSPLFTGDYEASRPGFQRTAVGLGCQG